MQDSRTILVVDDEPAIRRAMQAILDPLFHVVPCSDGASAIQYTKEHPGEVCAAFVDHGLPVMDGNQVCSALRTLDSTIRLIGFTGRDVAEFGEDLFGRFSKKNLGPEIVTDLATRAVRSAQEARISDAQKQKQLPQ